MGSAVELLRKNRSSNNLNRVHLLWVSGAPPLVTSISTTATMTRHLRLSSHSSRVAMIPPRINRNNLLFRLFKKVTHLWTWPRPQQVTLTICTWQSLNRDSNSSNRDCWAPFSILQNPTWSIRPSTRICSTWSSNFHRMLPRMWTPRSSWFS